MAYRLMRSPLSTFVVVLALAGILAPGLAAQEATPDTDPIAVMELAPGVTAEVFAAAPSNRAPGQTVYLARFVFQPGGEIFPHGHPGTTVLGVASGSFGWTLLEGTAHVVRGAAAGATGPVENLTEPGTEVILEPGDAIFYEDGVVHTARGAGDEAAVVFGTLVLTSDVRRAAPNARRHGNGRAPRAVANAEHDGRRPSGSRVLTVSLRRPTRSEKGMPHANRGHQRRLSVLHAQ